VQVLCLYIVKTGVRSSYKPAGTSIALSASVRRSIHVHFRSRYINANRSLVKQTRLDILASAVNYTNESDYCQWICRSRIDFLTGAYYPHHPSYSLLPLAPLVARQTYIHYARQALDLQRHELQPFLLSLQPSKSDQEINIAMATASWVEGGTLPGGATLQGPRNLRFSANIGTCEFRRFYLNLRTTVPLPTNWRESADGRLIMHGTNPI